MSTETGGRVPGGGGGGGPPPAGGRDLQAAAVVAVELVVLVQRLNPAEVPKTAVNPPVPGVTPLSTKKFTSFSDSFKHTVQRACMRNLRINSGGEDLNMRQHQHVRSGIALR